MRADGSPDLVLAMCLPIILSCCAVGPNYDSPDPPEVSRYLRDSGTTQTGGRGPRLEVEEDIPQKWWEVFRNKKLNRLIESAIERNPNLQAAEASIKIAYFNAEAQKGFFLPQISLTPAAAANLPSNLYTTSVLNQKLYSQSYPTIFNRETSLAVPATTSPPPMWSYRLITPSATISYTPDVWGKYRRTVEQLEAQQDIARYQLEAAYLAMTSNVVLTAIMEASLRSQHAAIEKAIEIEKELLDLLRNAQSVGWVSELDVLTQEALYAQTKQLLAPMEKQIALARNLLTALGGEYPEDQSKIQFQLSELTLPKSVPLIIPSKIVRQRPDVRAAEAYLHGAAAQIGMAIGARLPEFNLSATAGFSAYHFSYLFGPGTQFYNVLGSAAAPIFQGFSLLNLQKAAEANFDQASAMYRSSVIQAFHDVADMLRSLQSDSKNVAAAIYSEQVARKQLDIVRQQMKIGSVNVLMVLSAENNFLMTTVGRIQAEGNRLADVAGLFMALGGGWTDQVLKNLPPNVNGARFSDSVVGVKAPVNPSLWPEFPKNSHLIPTGSWNPSLFPGANGSESQ
jgi:NodT family efflux transporter outer membrane factor (OMF) lipoprotein